MRRPLDPEVLAAQMLEAVRRDRALLVTPRSARMIWRVGRWAPGFTQRASVRFVAKQRRLQDRRAAL